MSRCQHPDIWIWLLYEWGDIKIIHKPFREAAETCVAVLIQSASFLGTSGGFLARDDVGEIDGFASIGVDFQPLWDIVFPAE